MAAGGRAGGCVRALLEHTVTAARIDGVDDEGVSPIIYALSWVEGEGEGREAEAEGKGGAKGERERLRWDLRCAILLLEAGCSLVHRGVGGDTALHLAVGLVDGRLRGGLEAGEGEEMGGGGGGDGKGKGKGRGGAKRLMELLLGHGECDVDAQNGYGQTALHLVAELSGEGEGGKSGEVWGRGVGGEVLEMLLGRADVSIQDLEGRTVEEVASEVGGGWLVERIKR